MSAMGLVFLYFAAASAQWLWSSHFYLWGLSPQLLLVLTIALAARRGPIAAMGLGFLWGLFLDVLSARLFGANAFALTLVGYGTGSARRQIDVSGFAPQCVVVLIMTWGYFLLLGVLGFVFSKDFLWVGWPPFLLDPFYNVLVAAFLYAAWDSWRRP